MNTTVETIIELVIAVAADDLVIHHAVALAVGKVQRA